MIKGGYILQPRKLDESDIMNSPPHIREIWSYILRKANYYDHGDIKRGQLYTSYKQIINDLSWHIGYRKETYKKHHCEIAMKALTKKNMITTTKTTRGLIITICNYEYYQDPKNYECYNENITKATRKLHDNDTIHKEDKKEKEYKNKLLSELSDSDVPNKEHFEITIAFWKLFKKNILEVGGSTTNLDKAKGKWIDSIRLLLETDKQNIDSVRTVFTYLQYDDFWKKNILSTATLRKQFNRLLLNAKSNGTTKKQPATTIDDLIEINKKHFGQ